MHERSATSSLRAGVLLASLVDALQWCSVKSTLGTQLLSASIYQAVNALRTRERRTSVDDLTPKCSST